MITATLARRATITLPAALVLVVVACAAALGAPAQARQDVLELDPAATFIQFTLSGNIHTTHGTFALKSGTIRVDPSTGNVSGEIVVDPASGNTNQSMRDGIMKDSVLETQRYPEISFIPSTVRGRRDQRGNFQGSITGVMNLHGTSHEMTLDVHGALIGDSLTAKSHLVIPYVAWGLKDPSFLFFRVADTVDVEFSTTGHVTWADKNSRDQSGVGFQPR